MLIVGLILKAAVIPAQVGGFFLLKDFSRRNLDEYFGEFPKARLHFDQVAGRPRLAIRCS